MKNQLLLEKNETEMMRLREIEIWNWNWKTKMDLWIIEFEIDELMNLKTKIEF